MHCATKENHEETQNRRYSGRDSNMVPPGYKSGLPATLWKPDKCNLKLNTCYNWKGNSHVGIVYIN